VVVGVVVNVDGDGNVDVANIGDTDADRGHDP
jgi:hypothetical protein